LKTKIFDLKAVNPNRKDKEDKRKKEELIVIIEAQAREIVVAIAKLKNSGV